MDNIAPWISGAALIVSLSIALMAFLRHPIFVPASEAETLKNENAHLRAELQEKTVKLASAENQIIDLMRSESFWQDEYRKLRATRGMNR